MVSPRQLKALIKLLKAHGVVSFKHEGLELVIDPNFKSQPTPPPQHVPGALAAEVNRASPGFLGMSDEQVLMWSADNKDV